MMNPGNLQIREAVNMSIMRIVILKENYCPAVRKVFIGMLTYWQIMYRQ